MKEFKQFKHYDVHEQIGEGSSSFVYRATDRSAAGRTVVVKKLKDKRVVPKRLRDISLQISSAYVCKFLDSGQHDDGSHCLVEEYVDGSDLKKYLKDKGGKLAADDAVRIALDVAHALEVFHEAGLVYRDLSPSNVLIPKTGKCKLTDLGHVCPVGTVTDLDENPTIGTEPYAAPEQSKNGCSCDARSDVYALGVLLCEMLSGKPFKADDKKGSIPADLQSPFDACIRRCTDMDPTRRFASVKEVVNVLEPRLPSVRLPYWYRKAAVATAIVVLAAVVAGMKYLRVEVAKPPAALSPDATRTKALAVDGSPIRKKRSGRVAILDFTNSTGDPAFDHYMIGIPQVIEAELSRLHGLTFVDASGIVEESPRQVGEAVDADTVITGGLQRENGKVVLTATLEDVGSDTRTPAARAVLGPDRDLFQLQGAVARQTAGAMLSSLSPFERKELQTATSTVHSPDAFHSFSDGLYFLRQDLPEDALKSFDQTVAADAAFPQVQYYRAQALEKLNRTAEAIQALKQALPDAANDQPLLWQWNLKTPTRHGVVSALDTAHQQVQHSLFQDESLKDFRRQVLYADVLEKSTALYFVDPLRHTVQRQELPETGIPFLGIDDRAYSDGKTTIVTALGDRPDGGRYARLYAFSADGTRLWNWTMPPEAAKDLPLAALVGNSFVVATPSLHRVDVLDAKTGEVRWSDPDMPIPGTEFPLSAHTRRHGDIVMFPSNDTYRAVRLSDGKDAWVVQGIHSDQLSQLVTDKVLIIFEPERRIVIVDLESGKPVQEIAMPQFSDALRLGVVPVWLVGALVKDNVLYVLSKDLQLCAISLVKNNPTRPFLWKTALPSRFFSIAVHNGQVYITTESNQLMVIDGKGAVVRTTPVPPLSMIHQINDHAIVLSGNAPATLTAISDNGEKLWEYPRVGWDVIQDGSVVATYTSENQIYAVDAPKGEILWKFAGTPTSWVDVIDGRWFVLGRDGVFEYSSRRRQTNISDRQIFTALARLYLQQHDLEQATAFAARAAELDPDYPPLALVRAHIAEARKKHDEAGVELARYASLVGVDSKEGQQAVSDMRRNYRLEWESLIDIDVVGEPVLVEGKLVSVGRRMLDDLHLLALNPKDGTKIWRYPAQRFVASMVATAQNRPVLWYVAGDATDNRALHLFRIDIRSGDQTLVTSWSRPARVEQAWMTLAGGRIFVAAASPNATTRTVEVGIDAFDVEQGRMVWHKEVTMTHATSDELSKPVSVFAGQNNTLTYAIGAEHATLLASTFAPTAAATVPVEPLHRAIRSVAELVDTRTKKVLTQHPVLWRPYTFHIESGHLYAFTGEGYAYAMKP